MEGAKPLIDLIYIGLGLASFALMVGYATLCSKL